MTSDAAQDGRPDNPSGADPWETDRPRSLSVPTPLARPGLLSEPLELRGRIMPASNATFLGEIDGVAVVYKPEAGERPLWDFPDGTLAGREIAAYLISEATGWGLVPPTFHRDGPHGPGMVQVWCEPDQEQDAVDLVPEGLLPDGWCHVLDAFDQFDRPVSLIHEDSAALRRMAVFDAVVNNADRKGGHVLAMPDGHRYGVDHGIALHQDPKLRTVLWGWAGEPLDEGDQAGLQRLATRLDEGLATELGGWITGAEVAALIRRMERLQRWGALPEPSHTRPAIPWPPF